MLAVARLRSVLSRGGKRRILNVLRRRRRRRLYRVYYRLSPRVFSDNTKAVGDNEELLFDRDNNSDV